MQSSQVSRIEKQRNLDHKSMLQSIASCWLLSVELSMIAMHAGTCLRTMCMGKHGSQYQTNFISQKPVLTFQTLMLAMLGKWATTHGRVFLGQELLLDFAAWIDLTSNTNNAMISVAIEVTEHILLL